MKTKILTIASLGVLALGASTAMAAAAPAPTKATAPSVSSKAPAIGTDNQAGGADVATKAAPESETPAASEATDPAGGLDSTANYEGDFQGEQ